MITRRAVCKPCQRVLRAFRRFIPPWLSYFSASAISFFSPKPSPLPSRRAPAARASDVSNNGFANTEECMNFRIRISMPPGSPADLFDAAGQSRKSRPLALRAFLFRRNAPLAVSVFTRPTCGSAAASRRCCPHARARARRILGGYIYRERYARPGPASLHAQSLFTLRWKRRARSGNQYREKP